MYNVDAQVQGAGGDPVGAGGCEHQRQWCVGSGAERAGEGLCPLPPGQLHSPQAAPQVPPPATQPPTPNLT